jgi:dihydrofolate synthase/folylpolyglutamate synthase
MTTDPVDAWLQGQAGLNPRDIELGLERMRQVWERLGRPQPAPLVITVGGTNGKGSCVALLEAILTAAGYRVGCYTSPHLQRYAERVRIAGVPVADQPMLAALQHTADARAGTPLTYFELGTLAALQLFAAAALDVAILEVGLGGRLDAVNLVDADAALVSSIALDHQDWLGPDREAIGREKAGIFRAGRPAVCADPDPPQSLLAYASEVGAELRVQGRDFAAERSGEQWHWRSATRRRLALPLPALRGPHQLRNAAAVLAVLDALAARLPVDQGAVREGLLAARLPGRFQVEAVDGTTWVLDVAHNPEAAAALRENLGAQFVAGRTLAVLGMLRDKDVGGVVAPLLDQVDEWHLAGLDDPRGLSAAALAERLERARAAERGAAPVMLHPDPASALEAVRAATAAADRVLVFGSFVTVGAALDWLQRDRPGASKAV